jgi:hypothetical protein
VEADVLRILESGNEFLRELVDQFQKTRSQANKAQITCFYELKSSDVGGIVGGQKRVVRGFLRLLIFADNWHRHL